MDKDKVLLDKSAFSYLVAGTGVVLGLMMFMTKTNGISMEAMIMLMDQVKSAKNDEIAAQDRDLNGLRRDIQALKEEITSLRGRLLASEMKVINLENRK